MISQSPGQRHSRPFKSAEKPVSLYPLSYKQALEALLEVGPPGVDHQAEPTATKTAATDD